MTTPVRRMSFPLLLGLLCAPAIFCWLLLRKGYETSLRRTVFSYTAILTGIGFVGRLSG